MDQDTLSFWADIGKYEETLAKDPKSFCFAPLADLYRKLGLLDEAITVASKGCDRHPGYIGGFMALGRAYYEKGLKEESRAALEKVIEATPENHLAQKLLSQLYFETGDKVSAKQSLQMLLSLNPDDKESRDLLSSLQSGHSSSVDVSRGSPADNSFSFDTDVVQGTVLECELALDEVEIIEELTEEIIDHQEKNAADEVELSTGMEESGTDRKDPLKTATLAELYVSQGFLSSALSIYRELLKSEPGNKHYERRLLQIRQALAVQEKEAQQPVVISTGLVEFVPDNTSQQHSEAVSNDSDPVAALEGWLENIQRRR